MKHYFGLIIVPASAMSYSDPEVSIKNLLQKHDAKLEVSEYKVYVSEEETKRIIAYFGVKNPNPVVIAEKIKSWNGSDGFVDQFKKVYYLSTKNPLGKFNHLRIGGLFDGIVNGNPRNDQAGNLGLGHEMIRYNSSPVKEFSLNRTYLPDIIITPESEWVDLSEKNLKIHEHIQIAEEIIKEFPDHYVVGLDLY